MDPWDTIKCTNTHILGVLVGCEKKKEVERIFEEIMAEYSPNFIKDMDLHIQEAQRPPGMINSKRSILSAID